MESIQRLREICQSGKEHDPAWYVAHRRLSIYLTRPMLHAGAGPMVASLGMLVCGLAGAALLTVPDAWANVAGFALLYLSFLFDKVDGEIARYRGVASTRGILVDRFHHRLVEPLMFVAAAVHAERTSGESAIVLGLVTVVLSNVIEEHQQLPAVVLLKYVRDTGRLPAPRVPGRAPARGVVHSLFRVLKGFRLFIVALPGLALAYAVEAVTGLHAIEAWLALSVGALGAYVLYQVVMLWSGGMDSEIERAKQALVGGGSHERP